jgi:hypothetical protein
MKLILSFLAASFLFVSCNQQPSLQKYFVDKSEKKEFMSFDLSPSILNLKPEGLTPAQQKALATFNKINILAFKADSINGKEYDVESLKVKEILKDDKYQELMHVGSGKDGGSISYVGDENHIEEFVLYGRRKENGFVVVRVLGKDMSANSIMEMLSILKSSNINTEQLKPLQQLMPKFKG